MTGQERVAEKAARSSTSPALEMRGITKRFPGTLANDGIDLEIRPGEIHALLGENGAGKSTLMNILYGLLTPDSGEILMDGATVTIRDPADAIARGIGMVHQHFMLVPVLSVAENVMLGSEVMRGPVLLDVGEAAKRIRALAEQVGFTIDPGARVEQLSVGQQQRVEIVKALYRRARILVLDEPTAVLTPQETDEIFTVLRRLRTEGTSIVFISHKLDEVLRIADRITVIRRGKVVGELDPGATTEQECADLMVGRSVSLKVDRGVAHPGEPVLSVRGLVVRDDRGHETVRGVDLEIRSGEIVGIAGVAGNGQEELVEAITGLRKPSAGHVSLTGRDVTGAAPRAVRDRGVGYVPADRQRYGLVLGFPVDDNTVLTEYLNEPYAHGVVRDDRAIRKRAETLIVEFDIRAPGPDVRVSTLSGGNQQKVVVAREFGGDKLLILDQPTRGIDVGSTEFIHKRTVEQRDAGSAVLLVSADLDEVLELSDRVLVIHRGRIVGEFDAASAERDKIGLLMARGQAA
ncbi:MAG: ABC transporter ATP-binding protein [Chloroflexi bacterium]|nr:ABC transporter ATP-binding protein [Chloroflexota bacterium]